MPIDYTATALIASVRRRAMIGGNASSDWTDQQILDVMNEEMQDFIVPMVSTIGEEFFVAIYDFETVAEQAEYDIPGASIGSRVRDVQGLVSASSAYASMQRIEPEQASAWAPQASIGQPFAYYVQANKIVFSPTPNTNYGVRLKYYKRPPQIVDAGYSPANSVSGPTMGIYIVGVTSTTGMVDGLFSILDPVTYAELVSDLDGTVEDGTTLHFAAADLTTTQAADLVEYANAGGIFVATGDSPSATPGIPAEVVPVLTQRTAAVLLQSMRDPGAAQAYGEVEKALMRARHMLTPRADGLTRKVVNPYGVGVRGIYGGRRWGSP